jgi:uncharacterized protein (DUF1800 family)
MTYAGGWNVGFVGTYIRKAIRPPITGHFADIVKAVIHHPAMLNYLTIS